MLLNQNPPQPTASLGPNVRAWIGGMMSKAVSGAWHVVSEQAAMVLVNAIKAYYNV